MDPLSVAASVAGVANTGVQLSQLIYDLISTFYEGEKEMSSIANELSLLAMVLNELEGVLRRDSRVYRRRMVGVVNEILGNCENIFAGISKHVHQDTRSCENFRSNIRGYFQRHHVRPLQVGIESIKSTLNVLLHVVHLARVTDVAESYIPNAGTVFTHADVQMERRILVGVVLDNRQSILDLTQIEEGRDNGRDLQNIVEDKRKSEPTDCGAVLSGRAPPIERSLGQIKGTENGRFNSFRGCEGSSAITGTDTGLLSKSTKHSNTGSFGVNKEKQKDSITISEFDVEKPCACDKKQSRQVEGVSAGGDDDWVRFANIDRKNHTEKFDDLLDGVPHDVPIRTIIDENIEAAPNDSWDALGVASSDQKGKKRKEERKQTQKGVVNRIRGSRDAPPDPCVPARPAAECAVEVYEVAGADLGDSRPEKYNGRPGTRHTSGTYDLPSPSGSCADSLSQSTASAYHSMAAETPSADGVESQYSEEESRNVRQFAAITEGINTRPSKSQRSSPESEIVTPTASWFLSVVPHESSVTELFVRRRSADANYLRVRAEETAKILLHSWTNMDPDVISGVDSIEEWNATGCHSAHSHAQARDEQTANPPYQTSYTPQVYPMYPPQQCYPSPMMAPPSPNEKQTDIEELARLKKLILDEKAEQDMSAAATSTGPVAPRITEGSLENVLQRDNTDIEAVDSMRTPQKHSAPLWKAGPPRMPPVVMRDWLGRKFIFPVNMCRTWEGLHKLIREASGHVFEYRPMVEQGKYLISHVTGEVILPSTWEFFVQPGLEINMEIWNGFEAERDESRGGERANVGPKPLILPHAREVPVLGDPIALGSMCDDEPSVIDIPDNETDHSFLDGISYVERSDPRYLSIENVLLEQKKAKVEVEMKLERNRRFFQLKQQLMDQGAAIQARQDAADHAEQDSKLAWLEKQVRDQKEELDRLPPLSTTPLSSSADDSLSTSASSSPRRKLSLGARLLGRIPSRSIRSQGSIQSQQTITDG